MGQDRAVGANSFARDLNTAACSRADLAVLLATLPEAQWQAAALAAGFEPRIETVRVAIPGHAEKQLQTGALVSAPSIQPELPPYQPSELPELFFWRIRAEQRDHTPPPDSETQIGLPLQALPLSDPACPRPQQQELLTPARQARLLRRQLAIPRPGAALDMGRLCQLLAERKLPAQLPRQPQPHWPGRLQVVLDLSLSLRPFWADFWHLAERLYQILGQRLVLWRTREGDPYHVEGQDGRAGVLPLNDGPVLLLSDGGLYSPDSGRARRWQQFGRLCAEQGKRPMLIAPVPERKVQPMYAQLFELLLWDQDTTLQPFRLAHHGASARADREEHPGSAHLLTALAHASRVEPHLLRAWRLALADCGTDIGSEYEVWHHAKVRANILACAVAKEYRAELAQQWAKWPQPRRHQLAELRYQSNRHLSPLIQAEEALAEGEAAQPEARAAAQQLAEQLHSTLRHGGPIPTGELAAYLLTMAARRPELLAASPKLAGAWAWLRRDDLANGALQNLPAGVTQDMLADVLASTSQTAPYFLAQVGNQLGIYPAANSQPVCRLAELPKVPEYWQVECFQDDGSLGPARLLARQESFQPNPECTYRLRFGGDVLELEPVRRPEWAVAMGRDQDGLFAELKDGRRVYWLGKGMMFILHGPLILGEARFGDSFGGTMGFDLPHGFWWDAQDYRAWLEAGRLFRKPDWASQHGVDDYGYWAEFTVKGVTQRMRWIPPGEFLMGSPKDEPEREPLGNDETQHPVRLTHVYWMADTACTQALWQAVLGENPSRFKGKDLPVEQVSWDTIEQRFLPALNALLPGLDAGLPTEAQWEYACRAGTQTPFWFGDTISPEQVNYDGNHPYGDAPTGRYREKTVPVKELPANAWGLYQMHGNVWEWCADWSTAYGPEAQTDPEGPSSGRERVLRGGCWIIFGGVCRSAQRGGSEPGRRDGSFGFRLARGRGVWGRC